MLLSKYEGIKASTTMEYFTVSVFHNDNRVAKELPNGKIVHVIAETGWILV